MVSLASEYASGAPKLGVSSPSFLLPGQQRKFTLQELAAIPISSWRAYRAKLIATAKNACVLSRRLGDELSQISVQTMGEGTAQPQYTMRF